IDIDIGDTIGMPQPMPRHQTWNARLAARSHCERVSRGVQASLIANCTYKPNSHLPGVVRTYAVKIASRGIQVPVIRIGARNGCISQYAISAGTSTSARNGTRTNA